MTLALRRQLANAQQQARKWNAEADKYLAERDALQVRVADLERQLDECRQRYLELDAEGK